MRADIYGGLKNAVDHGYTLDQAVASFINSGYSAEEVNEAARTLNAGATYNLRPSSNPQSIPQTPQIPLNTQRQPIPQNKTSLFSTQRQPVLVRPVSGPVQQATNMFPKPQNQQTDFTQRLSQLRQQPAQITPQMPQQNFQQSFSPQPQTQPTQQQPYQAAPKRKMDVLLIVLVIILLASIGFFISSLLFKQQIADFLKAILS